MRANLLLITCFIFPLITLSQTSFESGYFIDNIGNKSLVLIKNQDWKNNPESFEYKLSEESEVRILTLHNTQEVVIAEKIKYTRHEVEIEQPQITGLNNLNNERYPEFKLETVFLKSLVEGNADLLLYRRSNSVQYFYNVKDGKVKTLVYKKYLIPNDNPNFSNYKIGENNAYKQALLNDLKCEGITLRDIESLKYKDNSLVDFFVKYNNCTGSNLVNYKPKQTKFLINLNARAGINFTSLETSHIAYSRYDIDFGSQSNFQFGIEAEVLLPFNNHKWAVIFEPTYQFFKAEKTIFLSERPSSERHTEIDYRSIDLPLGVRYFLFLNDTSKLFVNGSFVISVGMNSVIERELLSPVFVAPVSSNIALGIGYNYNNRISAEIRFNPNRDILSNNTQWFSNYNSTALILGYRFL